MSDYFDRLALRFAPGDLGATRAVHARAAGLAEPLRVEERVENAPPTAGASTPRAAHEANRAATAPGARPARFEASPAAESSTSAGARTVAPPSTPRLETNASAEAAAVATAPAVTNGLDTADRGGGTAGTAGIGGPATPGRARAAETERPNAALARRAAAGEAPASSRGPARAPEAAAQAFATVAPVPPVPWTAARLEAARALTPPAAQAQPTSQRADAPTRRDVEVRIGTVQIEFRAPSPLPPPAEKRTAAPAPRTEPPRFSPSRHYLRGS